MAGQAAAAKVAIDRFVTKAVADITIAAVHKLRDNTPVDTRWAQSNWVAATGGPRQGTVGSKMAVTFGPQNLSLASIATGYRLRDGIIFITNNVPYIILLNAGSSLQAPAMFVEVAIAQAIEEVARRL